MSKKFTNFSPMEDFDWLIGRKVVEAHLEPTPFNTLNHYGSLPYGPVYSEVEKHIADGYLILDDGTQVFINANEGCGGCSNGWYQLKTLSTVDNIITGVRLRDDAVGDNSPYSYSEEHSYKIFVYADNQEINLIQIDGDDGNGYYGTGYEITVVFPS